MSNHSFQQLTPALVDIPAHRLDSRSDDELESTLRHHLPVRHEKNCWAFWDQGFDNLRPWCKRNIIGWIRRLGPSWDVRCLDLVPGSPNHISNFVGAEYLPECLLKGNMTGPVKGQHASDMVRLPLVYLHGGVWLDCGTFLFRSFDDCFWPALEDSACPYELFGLQYAGRDIPGSILNGSIAARKHNPFIKRWLAVFMEIWKDRTECTGLRHHPLIRHLGSLSTKNSQELDWGVVSEEVNAWAVDYLAQAWCFDRVRLLVDESTGWNGPEYFRKHFCFLNALEELWRTMHLVAPDMQYALMSLAFQPELVPQGSDVQKLSRPGNQKVVKLDEEDPVALQRGARDWLTTVAAFSIGAKFSSGYWYPGSGLPKPLAAYWNEAGHEGDDIKEGTWAQWFRYASTNLHQTRNLVAFGTWSDGKSVQPLPDWVLRETDKVLHAGLMEPAKESDGWEFIPLSVAHGDATKS